MLDSYSFEYHFSLAPFLPQFLFIAHFFTPLPVDILKFPPLSLVCFTGIGGVVTLLAGLLCAGLFCSAILCINLSSQLHNADKKANYYTPDWQVKANHRSHYQFNTPIVYFRFFFWTFPTISIHWLIWWYLIVSFSHSGSFTTVFLISCMSGNASVFHLHCAIDAKSRLTISKR